MGHIPTGQPVVASPAAAAANSIPALADMRSDYIANAEGLGSIPLPGTVSGAVNMGVQMLKGDSPQILLDKLGERLAFERTGTHVIAISKTTGNAKRIATIELCITLQYVIEHQQIRCGPSLLECP